MLLLSTVWSDAVRAVNPDKGLEVMSPHLYQQLIDDGPKQKFSPKTFVALELIRTYAQDDGNSSDNQFALQRLRQAINEHVKHSLYQALERTDSLSFLKRSLNYIRGRLLIDRPAPKKKSEFNMARNKLNEQSRRPKVKVSNEKNQMQISKLQEQKLEDYSRYEKAMADTPEKQRDYILTYINERLKTLSPYNQKILVALVVCGNITPYNNYGHGRDNKTNWLNKAGPKKGLSYILSGVKADGKWLAKQGDNQVSLTATQIEEAFFDGGIGIIRGNAIFRVDIDPNAPFKIEEVTEVGRKKMKLSVGHNVLEAFMMGAAKEGNKMLIAKIGALLEA